MTRTLGWFEDEQATRRAHFDMGNSQRGFRHFARILRENNARAGHGTRGAAGGKVSQIGEVSAPRSGCHACHAPPARRLLGLWQTTEIISFFPSSPPRGSRSQDLGCSFAGVTVSEMTVGLNLCAREPSTWVSTPSPKNIFKLA